MAIQLPNFNLTFDLWVAGSTPAANPPTFTGVPCQVYLHSKADIDQIYPNSDNWMPPIYLRVPIGTVRPSPADIIQVNYLALDYYIVAFTQNIHMGFPNEYLMCMIKQCDNAGSIGVR